MVQYRPSAAPEIGIEAEWEIEAQDLQLFNKLGEGEFGEVCMLHMHSPALIPTMIEHATMVLRIRWSRSHPDGL